MSPQPRIATRQLQHAKKYVAAGLSVIPICADGSKRPTGVWKHRQQSRPTVTELQNDFPANASVGIGIVAGKVSGNLEILDFDDPEAFANWKALVPPKLLKRLPLIATPGGGRHAYYRCETIEGNQKLAECPLPVRKTLIETRGEGGYCLAPGSAPKCHSTKAEYRHIAGPPLDKLPTITPDERETLHDAARSLNEVPPIVVKVPVSTTSRNRPGDDFNRNASWDDILLPHGWTCPQTNGSIRYWRRPGKHNGPSATTGHCSNGDSDLLYVFSSNAHPFEPNKAYGKFAAFTLLNHDGDFAASAKSIRETYRADAPIKHLRYVAFPVDAIPNPICDIVRRAAQSIGCDPSFVAIPLLTTLAAAIGTTRLVRLKCQWTEPPILWAAIVGESGSSKTPAFKFALRAVRDQQTRLFDDFEAASGSHELAMLQYNRDMEVWKRSNSGDDPPERPVAPKPKRTIVSDPTIEAMAPILRDNPRGVLLARDELSGWFGGFNQYSGAGRSRADESHWLSMHNAEPILVDRKTGGMTNVPVAAVGIVGGIQPGILRDVLTKGHRESGLAARLLLAMPPSRCKVWTDDDVATDDDAVIRGLLDRLYAIEADRDDDGKLHPRVLDLSPEAKRLWVAFYNEHNNEAAGLEADLRAAWSKLEAYAPRLALNIELLRWATTPRKIKEPPTISAASMTAGIRLARWFAHEARRVYAMLDERRDEAEQRKLVEWIERKGGRVTARETNLGNRRFNTTDEAEQELQSLVVAGYGQWESTPPGKRGQPTRYFVLSTPSTVYGNSATPEKNGDSVDVDTVDNNSPRPMPCSPRVPSKLKPSNQTAQSAKNSKRPQIDQRSRKTVRRKNS